MAKKGKNKIMIKIFEIKGNLENNHEKKYFIDKVERII